MLEQCWQLKRLLMEDMGADIIHSRADVFGNTNKQLLNLVKGHLKKND